MLTKRPATQQFYSIPGIDGVIGLDLAVDGSASFETTHEQLAGAAVILSPEQLDLLFDILLQGRLERVRMAAASAGHRLAPELK